MFTNKLILSSVLITASVTVNANEVLGGIEGLACEAILCLSSSQGGSISECNPSLSYYYSLKSKDFSKTIKKRLNFLNQCPVASQTTEMRSLVSAISRGAGRCDAASLNATLTTWTGMGGSGCISNVKPAYCSVYEGHGYTDMQGARYVVTPKTNNFWPFQPASSNFGMAWYAGGQSRHECGKWVD